MQVRSCPWGRDGNRSPSASTEVVYCTEALQKRECKYLLRQCGCLEEYITHVEESVKPL
ncbi:hypothetical protein M758_4G020200 [Ceratodon purpureus]|nr:hypothetical protein M758_4G020200 [Ceratodon purpureus]